MNSILIVDDEESMCEFLTIILNKEGYKTRFTTRPHKAIELFQSNFFDLALIDIKMPKMSGLELLKCIKEMSSETHVIMMTAYASTQTAVQAIKLGAYDYLTKPFKNNEEIKNIIKNALESKNLKEENQALRNELLGLKDQYKLGNLVGKGKKMKKIFSMVYRIAESRSTVLITGESGTGKELMARAIHMHSKQKDKAFVGINCGALPEGLLESELFGHVKGSFTGAVVTKMGLFEMAHEGTLFLDEIGTTPLSLQVKLLRVLQDQQIRKVGSTEKIQVNVRVIAATNLDPQAAVAEGVFREDLFYRLNVIPIQMPPLRERSEDIPLLANHFLSLNSQRMNQAPKKISSEAMNLLTKYSWPGNVREIENVIERAVILASNEIIYPEDLPENIHSPSGKEQPMVNYNFEKGVDLEKVIDNIEKDLIFQALDKSKGNKTQAADLLNLSFRSFRYRLKKYLHD